MAHYHSLCLFLLSPFSLARKKVLSNFHLFACSALIYLFIYFKIDLVLLCFPMPVGGLLFHHLSFLDHYKTHYLYLFYH